MDTLEQLVSPVLLRALGWTLLHSLWQGSLVAAVLAGALLLLRRQRAEVRYATSAGALALVVALAGLTFGLYFTSGGVVDEPGGWVENAPVNSGLATQAPAWSATTAAPTGLARATTGHLLLGAAGESTAAGPVARLRCLTHTIAGFLNEHLALLVLAWLLGLLAMSLRLLGGLLYVQRLRRYRVRPLPDAWQQRLAALASRAGVRRPVALLESALVRVPLVVGHMRSAILLPLGTMAGLSPAYLEVILAHELAHVLRRDYLVNLLQTVAEALFFYHPGVWFMAGCVRTERENCCDDTATVLMGGDALQLARALTALAEWSQSAVVPAAPQLALAALNRPGALLLRVRRLVQRRPAAPTLAEGLLAAALMLGGLGLLGGSVALAGPLTARNATGPLARNGQTLLLPGQAGGLADTNKRAAKVPAAPATLPVSGAQSLPALPGAAEAATVPELPSAPLPERRETGVNRHNDNGAAAADEPRPHHEHRVEVNGPAMPPSPAGGQPGTVVITKDRKGRLTDLVVDGQRVETTASHKSKAGGQQVEIVRLPPMAGPGFSFRSDDGHAPDKEQRPEWWHVQRDMEREAERAIARQSRRAEDFRFDFNDSGFRAELPLRTEPGRRVFRFGQPNSGRAAKLEALRGAERGLRIAAATKGLTTAQRQQINKELAKVHAQLQQAGSTASSQSGRFSGADSRQLTLDAEMRERDVELHGPDQEVHERQRELQERTREMQQEPLGAEQDRRRAARDRAQALRDLNQASQDRAQAERDRAQADRDRAQADRDRAQAARDHKRAERDADLFDQLQKDGLIQDKDNVQLRLTPNSLQVDGKEQSAQLRDKYLKLHAEASGHPLSGNDVVMLRRNGRSEFGPLDGPRPPRAPRPPRVPRAPREFPAGPELPAPPAPPRPPRVPRAPRDFSAGPELPAPPRPPRLDTDELRRELRKDGLLGADEKNLQFQLNASGLTVNGHKQADELAAKYRRLTGHNDGKNFNIMISTQED